MDNNDDDPKSRQYAATLKAYAARLKEKKRAEVLRKREAMRLLREEIQKQARLEKQRQRLEALESGRPGMSASQAAGRVDDFPLADPYNPWDSGLLNLAGIRATSHCPEPDAEDDVPGWTTAQAVLGWSPLCETEPDVQMIPIFRYFGSAVPSLRLFDTWFLARRYRS